MKLTKEQVSHFASLPLKGLGLEYPNHIMHLMVGPEDAKTPRELHPVFYGCLDWHSAVHGFWLLVRCLNVQSSLLEKKQIEDMFNQHFTVAAFAQETAYFQGVGRGSYERPYGWAWVLALAQELEISKHPQAGKWAQTMQSLVTQITKGFLNFLPYQNYPIRVGTHYNTAFAMILAYNYAQHAQDIALINAIETATRQYYSKDENYPAYLEPNGDDFLSASLCEVLLMSRIFSIEEFMIWFEKFLPNFNTLQNLLNPVKISDRSDPKICHLEGLNLSRAWAMRSIAKILPESHQSRETLYNSALLHLQISLPYIASGHYLGGEHWLATFAMLAESA